MPYPAGINITVNKWAGVVPLDEKEKVDPPFDHDPSKVQILRPYTTNHEHSQQSSDAILGNRYKLLATTPNLNQGCIRARINTIPPQEPGYLQWYRRMEPKKSHVWRFLGIDEAIRTSLYPYHVRPDFLTALTYFWNPRVNCFCFPRGMMGPNMLDVGMIARLPVTWMNPATQPLITKPKLNTSYKSWSGFIRSHVGTEEITDTEHTAFLLYWLSHYIIWPRSKKPSPHLLGLATWLAQGHRASVGSLFLAELYHGINTYVEAIKTHNVTDLTLTGPMWFLEVWARLFFSLGVPDRLAYPKNPPFSPPAAIRIMQATKHDLPLSELFNRILLDNREDKEFFIYAGAMYMADSPLWGDPAMLPTYLGTNRADGNLAAWDSIIRPRCLFTSLIWDQHKTKIRPEIYMPHCLARQLGCCQGFPGLLPTAMIPDTDDLGFIPPKEAVALSRAMDNYVFGRTQVPFRLTACALTDLDKWWGRLWSELQYSTTDLIFRLGLTVDDVIEPQPDFANPLVPTRSQPKRKSTMQSSNSPKKLRTNSDDQASGSGSQSSHESPIIMLFAWFF